MEKKDTCLISRFIIFYWICYFHDDAKFRIKYSYVENGIHRTMDYKFGNSIVK